MSFIQPLELETWIISVFSGSQDIFLAISIMVIAGLAGYFRMNGLTMFFMLGVFLIMFSNYITNYLLMIVAIIGGLLIGIWISKLVKN